VVTGLRHLGLTHRYLSMAAHTASREVMKFSLLHAVPVVS
jgi:hypothetical protein